MIFLCLGNHDAYPADSYIDAENATEEEVTQYKMYWNQGGFGKHIGKPFPEFLQGYILCKILWSGGGEWSLGKKMKNEDIEGK